MKSQQNGSALIHYGFGDTLVGPALAAWTERGLCALRLMVRDRRQALLELAERFPHAELVPAEDQARNVFRQVEAYLAGKADGLALDLHGTPFQRRVWEALLTIPYGETRSYGEIARQIGSPGAFRAVGLANGHNPIGIIVPCHRVIGSDGGLFSRAEGVQERPYVTLFPFQRVELLEDFGVRPDGAEIALVSREFSGMGLMGSMMGGGGMMGGGMMGRGMMGGGMMGGMMGRGGMMGGMMGPSQGEELHIARFTVSAGPREPVRRLVLPKPETATPEGANELRTQLAFRHMRGFLNGRRFDTDDMAAVADDERLPAGKPSVWTFTNDGGGMAMSHPIHVHGVRFRVIERRGGDVPADLREGIVDAGYKDTFGIFPGERVRLLLAPELRGLFMYHCHNLEHEDGGMMRNCLFQSQT